VAAPAFSLATRSSPRGPKSLLARWPSQSPCLSCVRYFAPLLDGSAQTTRHSLRGCDHRVGHRNSTQVATPSERCTNPPSRCADKRLRGGSVRSFPHVLIDIERLGRAARSTVSVRRAFAIAERSRRPVRGVWCPDRSLHSWRDTAASMREKSSSVLTLQQPQVFSVLCLRGRSRLAGREGTLRDSPIRPQGPEHQGERRATQAHI